MILTTMSTFINESIIIILPGKGFQLLKSDYHKPTDTVDKINWDLYEKRMRMIFSTAWEIANRNNMLKRDIPLPGTD